MDCDDIVDYGVSVDNNIGEVDYYYYDDDDCVDVCWF